MREKSAYQRLLDDPRWQLRRLQILVQREYTCEECRYESEHGEDMNVHHRYYRAGAKPWEYEDTELVCLCRSCHADMTDELERVYRAIGRLSITDLPKVVAFAQSLRKDIFAADFGARRHG